MSANKIQFKYFLNQFKNCIIQWEKRRFRLHLIFYFNLLLDNVDSKPGNCPSPSGIGLCVIACQSDKSCFRDLKCCENGCGGTGCMIPI